MRPPLRLLALTLLLAQACRCGVGTPATCESTACPEGSHCVEGERGPACRCEAGWRLEGRTCLEIDECAEDASNTCDVLATCTNTPGSYVCACPEELQGNGFNCIPEGPWKWVQEAPGPGVSSGTTIAVDRSGHTLVGGTFVGPITFGTTSLESTSEVGFIAKLEGAGAWRWTHQIGRDPLSSVTGVAVNAAGEVYVSGIFANTITLGDTTLVAEKQQRGFIAKLTSDGRWLWALAVASSGAVRETRIRLDQEAHPVLVGGFRGTATLGETTLTSTAHEDLFVARLSPEGRFEWVDHVSSSSQVHGPSLSFTPDNALVLMGTFSGTLSIGAHTLAATGSTDTFVARRAPDGTWTWAAQAGSSSRVEGRDVVVDELGTSIVLGTFEDTARFGELERTGAGGRDVFVAGLGADGTWQWVTSAGGPGADTGTGLAIGDARISVVGTFEDAAAFGSTRLQSRGRRDLFIAQLDHSGTWQWAARAGGPEEDAGTAIATGAEGGFHVTGGYEDRAFFLPQRLRASGGGARLFVGRVVPPSTDEEAARRLRGGSRRSEAPGRMDADPAP